MSTVSTIDVSKKSIRTLKMMRKWHRKHRAHPLHREAVKTLTSVLKKKQEQMHAVTASKFEELFNLMMMKRKHKNV